MYIHEKIIKIIQEGNYHKYFFLVQSRSFIFLIFSRTNFFIYNKILLHKKKNIHFIMLIFQIDHDFLLILLFFLNMIKVALFCLNLYIVYTKIKHTKRIFVLFLLNDNP